MIVITIDQRRSRSGPDKVETLLRHLVEHYSTERGFERTAGDEIQGVLSDGAVAVALALDVAGTGEWSVGIGVGAVQTPMPAQTRAGRGPAFEHARVAVERAKSSSGSLAMAGTGMEAERLEAELQLIALVNARRTESSAEAGMLVSQGLTQQQVATRLDISQQAVSARLSSGLWYEAGRLTELAGAALHHYSIHMEEG
ncbi:hypothetical protein ACIGB6_02650 [Paeniglutamicibacter gangotriensis]|uniref:Uncharacterized protein n=1 Tax=Paeniglutamicibacter gangotriensis TaxID=254787 RepID=A0A5B0E9A8_9MICC|nr:hypothetical protein [Paeniglutamicibacter gangotriensis]KAA0974079.1 hypothetical protein FQ154_16685 [Paeniglutamicibacter gangotriensis]